MSDSKLQVDIRLVEQRRTPLRNVEASRNGASYPGHDLHKSTGTSARRRARIERRLLTDDRRDKCWIEISPTRFEDDRLTMYNGIHQAIRSCIRGRRGPDDPPPELRRTTDEPVLAHQVG